MPYEESIDRLTRVGDHPSDHRVCRRELLLQSSFQSHLDGPELLLELLHATFCDSIRLRIMCRRVSEFGGMLPDLLQILHDVHQRRLAVALQLDLIVAELLHKLEQLLDNRRVSSALACHQPCPRGSGPLVSSQETYLLVLRVLWILADLTVVDAYAR